MAVETRFHFRSLACLAAALAVSAGLSAADETQEVPAQTTAAGVYSTEQADRGRGLFELKCESCHGAALDGGTLAPPLKGSEFLSGFQGKPLRRLYSRIISTMPPEDVGNLTESETLALVAYVLRANRYPAGPSALARADDLNAITIAPPPEVASRKSKVKGVRSTR